jgi:hypothetical protein
MRKVPIPSHLSSSELRELADRLVEAARGRSIFTEIQAVIFARQVREAANELDK